MMSETERAGLLRCMAFVESIAYSIKQPQMANALRESISRIQQEQERERIARRVRELGLWR